MSTQQDIYAAGSESRPPMLNKENYVPWSSCLLRYAKSRPNGKLIHNSILNGPYVRKMIPELGDANRDITVTETFYLQTDDELSDKELKQIEADDQAIQTILLGLPEDIYAAVDSCETAQEIWLRPEWSRYVTIVHQTKDSHTSDYTQLYDFLKYNQKEVDELKAKRLVKIRDPLALMENSNNPYAFPAPQQDQSSFNQNYLQQPMPNPKDITDSITAMNMAHALMAKVFKLNNSTPTNNNQRISSNPKNRQIAQPRMNMGQDRQIQIVRGNGGNQFRQYAGNPAKYNDVIGNQIGNGNLVAARTEGNTAGQNGNQIRCYNCRGIDHYARNCTVRPKRRDAAYLQTQLLIAQKEEARIQLQAKEYDLMAAAADLDEIEEVNANCILMANLQQASTSGTQTDSAPVYDTDGSAEHDNDVISEDTSMEQGEETVEQHPANFEETRALYESLYQNLAIEVEKVNSVNCKLTESNAHMTTELNTSENTKFVKQPIVENLPKVGKTNVLSKPVTSNSVSTPQEPKSVNNDKVIAPGMFRINPSKISREEKQEPNTVSASAKTKPITVSQPSVITKKDVNSDLNGLSFTGVDNTKTRRPQPRSYTKHDRVPSAKNSYGKNQKAKDSVKEIKKKYQPKVAKPKKTSREEKQVPNTVSASARTKPITVSQPPVITKKDVNSDLNGLSSTGIDNAKTKRPQPRSNTKNDRIPSASKSSRIHNKEAKVEEHHRNLLLSKNNKHISSACNNIKIDSQDVIQICLWCIDSGCSKHMTENLKLLINFVWKFLGIVRLRNDHVAAILGFGDLQWGNILITKVYFVEGLGHNLFSVGQFCDSDLEVAFRRDVCFVRNLEGVDLLKRDRSTNVYTINLHEMASASPICLMARASSTKSWLWHQRLSHLNFDTINDLARNDLVAGLPKFKYHKEHLCPSCEQGKSKRISHPPKPVPNSRQRLHLLYIDLCGPMRIASINGKRYVLVIVDDYSRYTWVHFLRSKDEAPEVIIKFLKRITVLFQSSVIIIRTNNSTEFKNQVLKEYFDTVGISHQMSSVRTSQQNGVAIATACFTQNRSIIHRRFNKTPYGLINGRKPNISFLYVFGALCYPKNDRKDIGKLGAKGDIGFFIGYSADSCAYRVYNRWTKKIMETMNVSFDELLAMAFEQRSLKPRLNSMTSGHISSGLDLTYAPSTITTQQPSEGELDLLFEAMYDDYIGGQPSATVRTVPSAQEPQVRQTSMTSTTIADTAPIPTNSSSHATNILISSQDVDELNPNAMVDGNTFVNPFANSSTSAAASSS
nr:retrovirus-related Pol polyprotein from transposon TNT 1-94 [Tanacetum cinerariifolium]